MLELQEKIEMSEEDGSAILARVTKRRLVTKSVDCCRGAFLHHRARSGHPGILYGLSEKHPGLH
jgi:hypothetical protein